MCFIAVLLASTFGCGDSGDDEDFDLKSLFVCGIAARSTRSARAIFAAAAVSRSRSQQRPELFLGGLKATGRIIGGEHAGKTMPGTF